MAIDITRLALGLLIALFHRPIADFILRQEEGMVVLLRSRGVPLPNVPSRTTAHNLYFALGMVVAVISLLRVWLLLHP